MLNILRAPLLTTLIENPRKKITVLLRKNGYCVYTYIPTSDEDKQIQYILKLLQDFTVRGKTIATLTIITDRYNPNSTQFILIYDQDKYELNNFFHLEEPADINVGYMFITSAVTSEGHVRYYLKNIQIEP